MANTVNESVLCRSAPLKWKSSHFSKKGSQGFFCLKGASPNVNHILGLGNSGFYSVGGMFPNHWDPVFRSIVDNLFQTVGMRLGFNFHFIRVEGEVSGDNNIVVNAVSYCKMLKHTVNE